MRAIVILCIGGIDTQVRFLLIPTIYLSYTRRGCGIGHANRIIAVVVWRLTKPKGDVSRVAKYRSRPNVKLDKAEMVFPLPTLTGDQTMK